MFLSVPKIASSIKGLNEIQEACFVELFQESDRGCVIVGCAMIDELLKFWFMAQFISGLTKDALRELFDFTGPLGSFSSRIKLAYALGFISKDIYTDLNAMRGLRNTCAHSYIQASFNKNKFEGVCKNLQVGKKMYDKIVKQFLPKDPAPDAEGTQEFSEARFYFMVNTAEISSQILSAIDKKMGIEERKKLTE